MQVSTRSLTADFTHFQPADTAPPAPIPQLPDAAARLAALTAQVTADLAMMGYATKPWVLPRAHLGQVVPDVVIIGAGQSGLALGHMLKRRGVTNVLLLDRNPAGYEGVWDTYARNYEIRSPKTITGLELGIPSLTVQSWFVALHGQAAWDVLTRVPRAHWMDYLRWYRQIADLNIRNDINVMDISYDADGVTLTLQDGAQVRTRYVVLATGMEGGGNWVVPDFIRNALPADRYNHSCEAFDASSFAGKDIGVLGAGASAFDATVAALDAGAASVQTFMRRPAISVLDLVREFENGGFLDHAHALSDETKWELGLFLSGLSQAPAEHHFYRALAFANFRFHSGAPWLDVRMDGDRIAVTTPKGSFHFDHLITATGVTTNMMLRPELHRLAADALLWRDRFTPPDGNTASARLNFPYLDDYYRFQPKTAGAAPGIDRIFAFNALAMPSMGGLAAVSISSHRFGTARLASGLTRALFLDQEAELIPTLAQVDTPCITLTPYAREMLGMLDCD